jgi:ABC-type multidrug transport system ATPase subunit
MSAANDPYQKGVLKDQQTCIATSKLTKRFNREWVFKNFTFEFQQGNTYAIVGPNGSGKSTLLQVLWGQVPPTSGTLQYTTNAGPLPVEEIAAKVSIATPYMELIEELTLMELLTFHFKLKKIRHNVAIKELLSIMYLEGAKDKYLSNFSSGMRQRVKLALAFYTEADMIFLDEPGTNLDDHAFTWYMEQLKKLPQNSLILIASNNPSEYPENAVKIDLMKYKV